MLRTRGRSCSVKCLGSVGAFLGVMFSCVASAGGAIVSSTAGRNCKNGKATNCRANLRGLPPLIFDLRGGGDALRIEDTLTTATYEWFGNSLYQNHPMIGPVFVELSGSRTSTGTITSESPTGEPFFPAYATNDLFLEVEAPAAGLRLFTKDPLHLVATLDDFVETDAIFTLEQDVALYLTSTPDTVAGYFLGGSRITAFPSRDITVTRTELFIDGAGVVNAGWDVWNLTGTPMEVYWSINATNGVFLGGATSGLATLIPNIPVHIDGAAQIWDRTGLQEIVLNVSKTEGSLGFAYDALVAPPVPEPTSILLWTTVLVVAGISNWRYRRDTVAV